MKKYLYCENCKKYPDTIKEHYLGQPTETRKWDGENYELTDSDIGDIEYEQLCKDCGNKLTER